MLEGLWDCGGLRAYILGMSQSIGIVYWQGVKREISKVLGRDISMHPVFVLLDGFPSDQFSKSHLFVLHIFLIAARKIMTVNWMKVHEYDRMATKTNRYI